MLLFGSDGVIFRYLRERELPNRDKWVWTLIVANVLCAIVMVTLLWATLSALVAFAAYVSGGPLLSALLIGATLSIIGLALAKRGQSSLSRRACYVASGLALTVHSLIIAGLVWTIFGGHQVRYVIPEGYLGDVFVIHNAVNGEPEVRTGKAITYRIPRTGILSVKAPPYRGAERDFYYYERADGSLQRITNEWLSTIPRTPENLADNREIGIFFPSTGNLTLAPNTPSECRVEYEQFYVGTKAYLLSGYKKQDLAPYLRENPANCSKGPNLRDYGSP